MKTKKERIILASCIVAILILVGEYIGYVRCQGYNAAQSIQASQNEVKYLMDSFGKAEDRVEKVSILKNALSKQKAYYRGSYDVFKGKEVYDEVVKYWKDAIEKMQSYFQVEYDEIISDNIIQVEESNNKTALNGAKANMESLSNIIQSESGKTCLVSDGEAYEKSISNLIKIYSDRVTAIEKTEAEAKVEAEATAICLVSGESNWFGFKWFRLFRQKSWQLIGFFRRWKFILILRSWQLIGFFRRWKLILILRSWQLIGFFRRWQLIRFFRRWMFI